MKTQRFFAGAAIVLASAVPALADGPAAAPQGPDVLHALAQCATIAELPARLACYDGLAPRVKAALAAPPAPAALAARHPPTKEEQTSWFGFNMDNLFGGGGAPAQTTPKEFGQENTAAVKDARQARQESGEEIDSITAKVTDYALSPFGKFVVFLDNGQVWKQIPGDADRAMFSHHGGNTVRISRGFLGSYNMTINDSSRVYKVTRVK